jgi:ComF family protein
MTGPITIIAKNFANLLYPLHCAACKKVLDPLNGTGLCSFCENQFKANPAPHCNSCGRSVENAEKLCAECAEIDHSFDRAWSAFLYEGVLKELIPLFKYRGELMLSGIFCSKLIEFIKTNSEIINNVDLITFVPTYNGWINEREYNQSGILAAAISKEFKKPVSKGLEKIIRTRRQNELSREERLINLNGAFRVKNSANLSGLRILLIDDVMTTGATLNECAKTLKASGAKEVRCLTLSRGV